MRKPWLAVPRRFRKMLQIGLFSIAALFVVDLSIVVGFSLIHPTVPHNVDAAIILGAKVGTPALKYRTLKGLSYYQVGDTGTLVLSGARGPGESVTEAQAMDTVVKRQTTQEHRSMPHTIMDTRSTNTFQNLQNSKNLLPHAKSVVIISDCYHLARSVAIAKHLGFQHVYWDAPKPSYYSDLDLAHYYVRETIAIIAYLPRLI